MAVPKTAALPLGDTPPFSFGEKCKQHYAKDFANKKQLDLLKITQPSRSQWFKNRKKIAKAGVFPTF